MSIAFICLPSGFPWTGFLCRLPTANRPVRMHIFAGIPRMHKAAVAAALWVKAQVRGRLEKSVGGEEEVRVPLGRFIVNQWVTSRRGK